MEAIVLAGGFGTRLRGVVDGVPKPMAPIAGRPFLEILLARLANKGFKHVVLSVGYLHQKIKSHFGSQFADMELDYEIEQRPLGTGGATRASLARCRHDHAFVFNGDTYLDVEVERLEKMWLAKRQPIIVLRKVADTERFGQAAMDADRVTAFAERGEPRPGLINAGCYVLPTNALEGFAHGVQFSLEADYFAKSIREIYFCGFVTSGYFIDIGVPADFERAQIELLER